MALLKDLTVYGASRFIGDVLSSQVYSDGFHHNSHDTDTYVLLAGGGAKALNTLATNDHNHNNSAAKTAWGQQYVNASGTLTTISGNMSSVGNIIPSGNNGQNIGSATNRWAKLYIGTADSYGSATKGIYWDAGVPKACTVAINSGTANKIAYYSSNNVISAATGKVGDTTKPIYLNDGVPTALSGSAGGEATPVYLNEGTITQLTATRGSSTQPVWLNGGEIVASGGTEGSGTQFVYLSNGVITKTTKTLGSTTKPVYLDNGVFKECSTMATSDHPHSYITSAGFSSNGTTSLSTWGTLKTANDYTGILNINESNGGSWEIAAKGGQISMQIDGYFYQNEGTYRVTDVSETVTNLYTSGTKLYWTKNGSDTGLTIPYATNAGNADTVDSYHASNLGKVNSYNLPSNKGVRITYPSHTLIIVSVCGTNSGAQLIIIGTGYGEGGRVRNQFTELVSCSLFDWSIPNSNDISCSVEVFSRRDSNSTVKVISTDGVSFTSIDALTSAKENATLLTSSNYTNYTVTKSGTGATGTWGINITGSAASASTATKLTTARNINGTSFDGSADITTANWGTARNISIADSDSTNTGTAVSVNGSAAVTLKLPSTIKAALTGNASTATKLANARTIWGQSFDGTANISGNMSSVGNISFSASGKNIGSILYFDTTNSRLGVGKSDPSHKLEVAGNVSLYSTSGDSPYLYFQRGTTSDSYNDWRINCVGGNLNFNMSSYGTWSTTPLLQLSTTAGTAYLNGYTIYHSGNLTYSTLGIKQRIITIDGTEYTFYSPYDTNVTVTTTKVTQTITTSSNTDYRPLIVGYSSSSSITPTFSTTTNSVYATHRLFIQPSTGDLHLYNPDGGDSPALYFQRGDLNTSSTFDYRMYVSNGNLHIQNNQSSWNTLLYIGYDGGKIGIGTTSPTEKLDVNGYVYATGFKTSMNSVEYCLTSNGGHKQWVANAKTASTIVARDGSGNIFVNWISTTAENIDSTDFAKVYVAANNSNVIKYVTKDKFFKDINAYDTLTFTKTLKVTEAWMDTGITTGDANTANTINKGNGTYVVQISHGTLNNGTDSWPAIYSGIMSIYHSTNGSLTDEIILHRSGHAGGKRLYLRVLQTSSSSGYCKIQIAAESNFEANASLTFTFRKLI